MSAIRPPSKLRPPKISIGVKVKAGGKSGIVAFVGETQFAGGIWAGVILDDTIGKNDGSIQGVRYFQTKENRGIFIRPDKLEVQPQTSTPTTPSPSFSKSPTPKTRTSDSDEALKVGDAVLYVGKSGTIRFVGKTEFKEGVWVGIELNEPSGKNDGTVNGVSYFKCPPKFGLFALPHKVTKLKGGRAKGPGSTANRSIRARSPAGSVSSFGSVASTNSVAIAREHAAHDERMRARAMQYSAKEFKAIMDEKEKQVASMLQERELDRDEIVKVSGQVLELTNELESSRAQLKSTEDRLSEVEQRLQTSTAEDPEDFGDDVEGNEMLIGEIEDLKQQIIDLEEEKEFSKNEWEALIASEREKAENFQNKLTESSGSQREVEELKSYCAELKAKLETKSSAVSQLESELNSEKELKQTFELEKEELLMKVEELDGSIEELKSKVQTTAEGKSEEVTQTLAQLNEEKEHAEDLEFQLEEAKLSLKAIQTQFTDASQNYESQRHTLKEELSNAKNALGESQSTSADLASRLEKMVDDCATLQTKCATLTEASTASEETTKVASDNLKLSNEKATNVEHELGLANDQISTLREDLLNSTSVTEDLQVAKDEAEQALENFKTEEKERASTSELILNEIKKELATITEKNEVLECELNDEKKRCSETLENLETMTSEAAVSSEAFEKFQDKNAHLSLSLSELEYKYENLNSSIEAKDSQLKELETENDRKLSEITSLKGDVEQSNGEVRSLQSQLDDKASEIKASSVRFVELETQLNDIKESSSKSSGELELQTRNLSEQVRHQLKQIENLTNEKCDLQKEVDLSTTSYEDLRKELDSAKVDICEKTSKLAEITINLEKVTEANSIQLKEFEEKKVSEINNLKDDVEESRGAVITLQSQLDEKCDEFQRKVSEAHLASERCTELEACLNDIKESSSKSSGELELQATTLSEQLRQNLIQLRKISEEKSQLESEFNSAKITSEELRNELEQTKDDVSLKTSDLEDIKSKFENLLNKDIETSQKIGQLEETIQNLEKDNEDINIRYNAQGITNEEERKTFQEAASKQAANSEAENISLSQELTLKASVLESLGAEKELTENELQKVKEEVSIAYAKISAFEAEVIALQEDVNKREANSVLLTEELKSKASVFESLSADKEVTEKQLEKSSEEVESLKNQIVTLTTDNENTLKEKSEIIEKSQVDLTVCSTKCSGLESELEVLKEASSKLNEEVSSLQSQLTDKANEIATSSTRCTELEAQLNDTKESSSKSSGELELQTRNLSEQVRKLESELEVLKGESSKSNGEVSALQHQLSEKVAEIEISSTRCTELEAQLHDMKESSSKSSEELELQTRDLLEQVRKSEGELEALKKASSKSNGELEAQLTDVTETLQQKDNEMSQLTKENEALSEQMRLAQITEKDLKDQLDKTQGEIKEGSELVSASITQISMLEEKISSVNRELEDSKAEHVSKDTQQKVASDTIYNLSKELSDLQVKMEESSTLAELLQEEKENISKGVNAKEGEIQNLKESQEQLLRENAERSAKYGANIAELSEQVGKLTDALAKGESSQQDQLENVLSEKNRCIKEMSEQIDAEILIKNQVIKAQEKLQTKYQELKASLSDEKTKTEGIKDLNMKMEEEITKHNVLSQNMQCQLQNLQNEIIEKESLILETQEKLVQKRQRADVADTLELENHSLEKKLVELEKRVNGVIITNTSGGGDASDNSTQLDFLNSIIAGQQKDIETQNERIKDLELMLVEDHLPPTPQPADETLYFDTTVSSQKKPVRSYCDICEVFDKHDTEDCPTQDGGDHFTVRTNQPQWESDDETF